MQKTVTRIRIIESNNNKKNKLRKLPSHCSPFSFHTKSKCILLSTSPLANTNSKGQFSLETMQIQTSITLWRWYTLEENWAHRLRAHLHLSYCRLPDIFRVNNVRLLAKMETNELTSAYSFNYVYKSVRYVLWTTWGVLCMFQYFKMVHSNFLHMAYT